MNNITIVGIIAVVAFNCFVSYKNLTLNEENSTRIRNLKEYIIISNTKSKNLDTEEPTHDFQLIQPGGMRVDQYLLDKKTGRIWTIVCRGGLTNNGRGCKGELIWQQMVVLDLYDNLTK